MLFNLDIREYMDDVPRLFKKEYSTWIKKLPAEQLKTIKHSLEEMIDADEIHTSSWMPGSDWSGTVFYPIYETACRCNEDHAAICFGLILREVIIEHSDVWAYGKYEKDGVPIKGTTYFKLADPPPR